MPPTPEQQRIIEHNVLRNGRVLAGPGTGKSWASVSLIRHLAETNPELSIRLLTFTRAATQELARKIDEAELDVIKPSTIHSFALGLLVRNPVAANLPRPIRIPDSWELNERIRKDLARRLRERGFDSVAVGKIELLERELSSRWQSLDDRLQLIAELEPEVRNAYVGLWETHRRVFGYTLLAELPYRAGNAFEDFDPPIDRIDLVIVDEYQDLNEADIRLIRLIRERGAAILCIGDDDQSIYGFRMAAPEGIRRFPSEFGDCDDYELTLSLRCGENILNPATTLIETVPERPKKPSLKFREDAQPGIFYYLRFEDDREEIRGVADLVHCRVIAGVALSEIVILVRSQVDTWAHRLIPALEERGLRAIETDWIKSVFRDVEVRKGLARLRLVIDQFDSLAWWTLLHLEKGISSQFCDYIYGNATQTQEKFGETLLRLNPDFPGAPTKKSSRTASGLINRILEYVQQINLDEVALDETGWGGWVAEQIGRDLISDDARQLFDDVGRLVPVEQGLGYFLNQIEPVAKDLATQSDAIRIMSITSSKGITVNTCVVMGVERGIIPHPKGDEEEERRLLYVALTRATDMSVLTFGRPRTGPTARQGAMNVNRPRGRCPFLENLPIGEYLNGREVVDALIAEVQQKR